MLFRAYREGGFEEKNVLERLRFVSLFDGVGTAQLAFGRLGWECVATSEISPFANAVTSRHFPGVPNLGDITAITQEQVEELGRVDLVFGGFPCQDLSVAGNRKGLEHNGETTRSGLFFDMARIADQCNARWVVAENVPGLFSSSAGRDFASVVGTLAGVGVGVPDSGWRNSGVLLGPRGLVEWATLDAQYFGLAQRRKRVFIVRDSGDWTNRPPIFLERESVCGNPPTRRTAGQDIAASLTRGADSGGRGGYAGRRREDDVNIVPSVSMCLNSGKMGRQDAESETLIVAHSLRGEGFDASEDGTGRGTPLVPVEAWRQTCNCGCRFTAPLDALCPACGQIRGGYTHGDPIAFQSKQSASSQAPSFDDVSPTLDVAKAGGIAVAYQCQGTNVGAMGTLRSGNGNTAGGVPFVMQERMESLNVNAGPNGKGWSDDGVAFTLESRHRPQSVAASFGVRRLTPRECERLQGLPDDWTNVTYRGKQAADGPRYQAIGNGMAVPVVEWIGQRINAALRRR